MRLAIILSPIGLLLSACAVTPPVDPANGLQMNSPEWRGQKFASNRCADCHSIGYGESSPLAAVPSFSAVANTPGLSSALLARWLRDHGNYPDEMYFEIPAESIDDLVAYMLTLRRTERQDPA